MSYPDIKELSTAYTLCTCGPACTRSCVVCHSPTYVKQPCVKILWAHANEATENNALQQLKPVYEPGEAVPLLQNMPFVGTISGPPAGIPANVRPAASPEELVERAIDWMEEQGQALEPWQAQAFRAIMLSRRP